MNKLKVIVVVGTRPELIRLSRILSIFENNLDLVLVHTGQNYDARLNKIFFEDLGISKPRYSLNCAGKTAAQTIANSIIEVDKILAIENPDAFLILGDTNSALSSISAKKRKIPIFHLEAGNRCFDLRVPEEINRKVVDHLADINLTYSTLAKNNLVSEGIRSDKIIKVGSPMREVLDFYREKIFDSKILEEFNLSIKKYFLFSAHREENVDSMPRLKMICQIIDGIAGRYGHEVVFVVHPRTRQKLNQLGHSFSQSVKLVEPLNFTDYVFLQLNSTVVISDSGTINEESSILKFKAINMRETHERPEAMEVGAVPFSGLNIDRMYQIIDIILNENVWEEEVNDYKYKNVSKTVLRVILSYLDYAKIKY